MNPMTYIIEETALPVAIAVTIAVTSFTVGRWAAEEFLDFVARKTGII